MPQTKMKKNNDAPRAEILLELTWIKRAKAGSRDAFDRRMILSAASKDHMTETQILQGIVDLSDLSDNQKAHLAACPVCKAEKDRLETTLLQLGSMARASAPEVTKRYVLPDRPSGFLQGWFFEARPFVRIALPALLVLVVVMASFLLKPGQDKHIALVEQQIINPDQLLADIDTLIENPLPQELQSMVSFAEIDTDEDFMEYIVPEVDNENDPLSNMPGKKGESTC